MSSSENPLVGRLSRRRVGDAGRRAEADAVKRLGARSRPASGAMAGAKGDMVKNAALVEVKSTTHASVKLELGWLLKVTGEAALEGRTPVVAVTFTDPSGRPVRGGEWALVPVTEVDFE